MATETSSSTDIWDVAGDDKPEMDDEATLLEPPPRLRMAFRMRLRLLDSLLFALLLDLDSRSDLDPRVWGRERVLEITWASELLSMFRAEGRESVGDEGGLRKDCWPLGSSKRKKAITAVHPE